MMVHRDLRDSARMSARELVFTEAAVVVVVDVVVVVVETVVVVVVVVVVVIVVVVVVDGEAVVVVVVAVLEAAPSQVLGQTAALPSMCSPPEVTSVEHQACESEISVLAASEHLLYTMPLYLQSARVTN